MADWENRPSHVISAIRLALKPNIPLSRAHQAPDLDIKDVIQIIDNLVAAETTMVSVSPSGFVAPPGADGKAATYAGNGLSTASTQAATPAAATPNGTPMAAAANPLNVGALEAGRSGMRAPEPCGEHLRSPQKGVTLIVKLYHCLKRNTTQAGFIKAIELYDRYFYIANAARMASNSTEMLSPEKAATAAFVVASKLEDIYPPSVAQFAKYSDMSKPVLAEAERSLSKMLQWRFTKTSVMDWVELWTCGDDVARQTVGNLLVHPTARGWAAVHPVVLAAAATACVVPAQRKQDLLGACRLEKQADFDDLVALAKEQYELNSRARGK